MIDTSWEHDAFVVHILFVFRMTDVLLLPIIKGQSAVMRINSILQMQYPRLDLLSLADIPEILAQISAGTTGNIHLGMILVMALWALPLEIIID